MRVLLIIVWLLFTNYCFAQNTYEIRADTVRIFNTCDTSELVLENHTQDTLGFLYNKGKGRTEFRRLQLEKIGNSQLAIAGQDTVDLKLLSDTGRVGIGTTNPLEKLHIVDSVRVQYEVSNASSVGPIGPSLMIENKSAIFNAGTFIKYAVKNHAGQDQRAYIGAISAGGTGPYASPLPAIVFGRTTSANSYSESMRISELGCLYINMTGQIGNPKLGVSGNAFIGGNLTVTGAASIGTVSIGGAVNTPCRVVNTDTDVTIGSTDYIVLLETPNPGTTQNLILPSPKPPVGSGSPSASRTLVLVENSSDTWNLNFTVKFPGGTDFTVLPANATTILQDINGSWYKIK